ncbi:phosphatidate cytidylyltransferase [Alkalilacustris brevis]|uniref:phosphatidate cytidylyltransferase n=1 Tax=Alkalilacustris brevis TaxID=2026338 RepID=UPI000E0D7455|nr:phosphatidate cytidylyltransferase [Alkalilacustris brevis]
MTGAGQALFGDLGLRIGSALVMAVIGVAAAWAGGLWFALLVALVTAAMLWEMLTMLGPAPEARAARLALAAGGGAMVTAGSLLLAPWMVLPILLLPAVVAGMILPRLRQAGAGYALLICLAAHALIVLRIEYGLPWLLWLVLLVVGSDMAGYFAGRILGGPKFWPRISPKKTWSGTVAGWLAGLAIGAAFLGPLGVGAGLMVLSLLVVMAGQLGDIAESALKRRVGVKDSSNLIPGHGGVLDRFDALIAAAALFLLVARFGLAAPGAY